MVIVVTGEIGIGKTTICRKLLETIRNQGYSCGGILTCKSADKDIIIEDIQSGEVEVLASTSDIYDGPRTARYYFNQRGLDFGVTAINKGSSAPILIVDEIGPLELKGHGFINTLELIKTGDKKHYIVVIRSELLPGFLPLLPAQLLVFEATLDNRDQLPRKISSVLLEKLRGKKT